MLFGDIIAILAAKVVSVEINKNYISKIYGITFFYLFASLLVSGQELFTVKINIVNQTDDQHAGENFYLTSNFNNWSPNSLLIGAFPQSHHSTQIVLHPVKAGLLEYKFTRGDWKTLASTKTGTLEGPLKAIIRQDTVLNVAIEGWRDDFPSSTLSPQVHLLDSAFHLPELDVYRRVWIYLPKDYAKSIKKYPVLYMHDGQDLFDEATSKGRIGPLEWGVDETLDQSPHEAIVVAIAHAENIQQRQNEYFVKSNAQFPHPIGELYLSDIVKHLKPYIDRQYRTLPDKKHTAMAGSSVGGLLTFYAGLLYPNVFGNLGVLSPSIWLDEGNISSTMQSIKKAKAYTQQGYYFYGGGNENRLKPDSSVVKMHEDIEMISSQLEKTLNPTLQIAILPEGRHGAWYWKQAFPTFFEWWQERIAESPI